MFPMLMFFVEVNIKPVNLHVDKPGHMGAKF